MNTFKKLSYDSETLTKLSDAQGEINGIEFEDCRFVDCSFEETTFQECKFVDCEFVNCNLRLAKLDRVQMIDVVFTKSNVSGIDFSTIIGIVRSVEFVACQMKYAVFTDIELQGKRFTKCDLSESSFLQVDLEGADFSESELKDARFEDCNLEKANFVGARNYYMDASSNKIKKAKFSMPEAARLLKNFDIEIE